MKRKMLFLFLLFYCIACKQSVKSKENVETSKRMTENFQLINLAKPLIEDGDLVFRNGNDEVSKAARSMNRKDTSFSHCGIIYKENDSLFVYHAIGGIYNPSQKLKRELLDSFCNPAENDALGVYRYNLNTVFKENLNNTVKNYYKAGLKFDLFFNFKSDDVMYCSEFVFKSLNKSTNGMLTKYLRLDTIPFGVTTDDLFLNENCQLIKRQYFKK